VITIIKSSTLAALRDQARELSQRLAAADGQQSAAKSATARAQQAQAEAEAARAEAEAKYDALSSDTAAGMVRLWDLAGTDPTSADAIKAGIALRVLRQQIAEVKASGDPALINGIRAHDAVIGEDGRRAAADALRAWSPAEEES
jgi:hypothetical protein